MTIFFFVILACVGAASAQTGYWPELLRAPAGKDTVYSRTIDVTASQNLKVDIYRTNNTVALVQNDSAKRVEQKLSYDLYDDKSLGLQNHYVDLSGLFLKRVRPLRHTSLGLEWVPTAALNRRPDTPEGLQRSTGIGSMRLGPVIRMDYVNLPIYMSGGPAVDVWNPQLPYRPGYQDVGAFTGDPGFYGSLRMGDNRIPLIDGVPFYAEGGIFGRYMNSVTNAKITNGVINALFLREVAFADTFFLYVADTLSKGRTAFLSEQAGGAARYSSSPNRTNNSLMASCGLKNIGEFILKPSLAYTLSLGSVSYPASERIVGDQKLMRNTFSCMARNDTGRILDYAGGVSFFIEDDDWLFKDELSTKATEKNKDSLAKNLQDYHRYNLSMMHRIGKTFENTFGFTYAFVIRGDKKLYPNFYTTGYDTVPVRYVYDKDNVDIDHLVNVTFFSLPRLRLVSLFDYYKNTIVYLRKEKSALNKTDRLYRVELAAHINPDSASGIDVTLGAFAKTNEYHFPAFADNAYPMSRRFYSRIKGRLGFRNGLALEGVWSEMYLDEGNYVDSADMLFLETQMVESSLELAGAFVVPDKFMLRTGSLFRYIYRDWQFSHKDKINYMTPFIELKAVVTNRIFVNARVERYIDPDANDYWEAFSLFNVTF